MLARIRKAQEESEGGFTLIELLVVMIIIGILAAIAIPVFLNQRKSARDSAIKSDLRNFATQMESYYTDNQNYVAPTGTAPNYLIGGETAKVSSGNTIVVKFAAAGAATPATTYASSTAVAGGTAFCLQGSNAGASHDWVYESDNGGLQPSSVTACP
jgi:prepilin-type N-terminal cleavage/methylation domain-containing protein